MAVVAPTLVGAPSAGRTGPAGTGFLTLTFGHTVPAGVDVLGVFVINNSFAGEAPEVSWNGTRLELVHAPPGGMRPFLYQLVNPSPGSGTIDVFHNHPFGTDIAAVAFNVKDWGGWRWAESTWTFAFDADPDTQVTRIYSDPTDLVLTFFAWPGSGFTATADAGQTVLVDQSGTVGAAPSLACGKVNAPVAVGTPAVQANYTESTWNVSGTVFNTAISTYMLAIKGWDRAAPASAPIYIGRVSDSMTLEQEPPQSVPLADNPWTWRHEIPFGHTTLVVLFTFFDSGIDSVAYIPDGGAPIALTAVVDEPFTPAGVWKLEGAPVGVGYIRPVTGRRWCGASAFSISGINISGDIYRGGVDPAQGLNIASSPGYIVVDRIGVQTNVFQSWDAIGPQLSFFNEPIYGAGNVRTATSGSNSAASSWELATASSTNMGWTSSPATGFAQAAFAFLPVTPPEPPEEPPPVVIGCPSIEDMTMSAPAVDGCASIVDMSVSEPTTS